MKIKKKILISSYIVISAALLGSCGKSESVPALRIVSQCNTANDLCKFELANTVLSRYTNVLGKTIERVESQTPLQNIQGTISWIPPASATLAESETVQTEFGSGCENNSCTANSNPTAYNLAVGTNTISVSGIVNVNGQVVDLAAEVPAVTIDTIIVSDSHVFPIGELPTGLTLEALVAALNINSDAAHGTFSADGSNLKITCEDGYEWDATQNPSYGAYSSSDMVRNVAIVRYDVFTERIYGTEAGSDAETVNGQTSLVGLVVWKAGCWAVT
ncbi:DUF3281 family protein [Francisella tularensis]|uniref:DUF3281 family protein n=1 Tax=Francisella tularensis TaxID=263 RepID=UPI0005B64E0B|nr:DUF3281 family protein [Francisella tularensis]